MGSTVPAVGGERLGELAGEDGVDHLRLLLPDGRVYPAASTSGRLRPHRHHPTRGPGAGAAGRRRGGRNGEAARGGGCAERGRHGSWCWFVCAARFLGWLAGLVWLWMDCWAICLTNRDVAA